MRIRRHKTTCPISWARAHLMSMDKHLKESPIIWIERHGKPVFAIVDVEYFECIEETLEIMGDPIAMADLQQAIDDIRADRVMDHEDVKRELDGD